MNGDVSGDARVKTRIDTHVDTQLHPLTAAGAIDLPLSLLLLRWIFSVLEMSVIINFCARIIYLCTGKAALLNFIADCCFIASSRCVALSLK
jgi:hypothetical protein